MPVLIGTSNPGKITEIKEVLGDLIDEVISPSDLGITESPHEEFDTFEGNAMQKARFYYAQSSGVPTLADDSGILVEALSDELGIHTRRWGAGPEATDDEWITYFLDKMKEQDNKRAHFVCVLAYIDEAGIEHLFEGKCSGVITGELEADYLPGLPISACFRPDGEDLVYSAMTVEQKNSLSHRGLALQKFRGFLKAA